MVGNSHAKRLVSSPVRERFTRRGSARARRIRKRDVALEIIDNEMNVMPFSCFDLSSVGAYLHSNYLLMKGDEIHLRLRLSQGRPAIEIKGEVVRVETGEDGLPPGMGIAFREIAKQNSNELKQFLMRRFLGDG